MKVGKIVIFIFSVLGVLSVISAVFPSEGLKAGTIQLDFPSLADILQTEIEEPQISPEELLQQRLEALVVSKENDYLDYCTNNVARIYMPGNDLTYFDDLFMQLEHSNDKLIRIVHYGDSQIEEDRMTSYLRERFQDKFGGSGVGMLPAVPMSGATFTSAQSTNPEREYITTRYAYGSADFRASHRAYGPMAKFAVIDTVTTVSIRMRSPEDYPHCQTFSQVKVRVQGSGYISFSSGKIQMRLESDSLKVNPLSRLYTAKLPHSVKNGTLVFAGNMEVQSIQLDGETGVVVDNVAMRGCSGTIFTSIDRKCLSSFYKDENVGLIILQFGGNSVPYTKSDEAIQRFCNDTKRQIEYLRQISPTSKILYIGPSDMSTSIAGQMQTYPHLPDFIKALQETVNQCGAAYWNMFDAMGGKGSMAQWFKARPQLAGGDYIHFTPKGAQRISEILYGTLEIYYNYYRFRNYERYSMADSIAADNLNI